jgi:hypothetical protein
LLPWLYPSTSWLSLFIPFSNYDFRLMPVRRAHVSTDFAAQLLKCRARPSPLGWPS